MLAPGAGEGGEDLVGRARLVDDATRPDGIRGAGGHEPAVVLREGLLDLLVAAPAVGSGLAADVHLLGADLPRELGDDLDGVAVPHDEGAHGCPWRARRRTRRAGGCGACPRRAGRGRGRRRAAPSRTRRRPAGPGGRRGAGRAGTTGWRGRCRPSSHHHASGPHPALEPDLGDVEVARGEAGLAVGEVELPLAAHRRGGSGRPGRGSSGWGGSPRSPRRGAGCAAVLSRAVGTGSGRRGDGPGGVGGVRRGGRDGWDVAADVVQPAKSPYGCCQRSVKGWEPHGHRSQRHGRPTGRRGLLLPQRLHDDDGVGPRHGEHRAGLR